MNINIYVYIILVACEQSVIIPVHNGERFLEECLLSVACQTFAGRMELSVYNDGSKVW